MISAELCAVPICAWAAVFSDGRAPQSVTPFTMERAAKGDRTRVPCNVGSPGLSVEVADQPSSAITVRDRDGSIIYRIDPATRATTIAKRTNQNRAISATPSKQINPPLPEGCESAFSPYVAGQRVEVNTALSAVGRESPAGIAGPSALAAALD